MKFDSLVDQLLEQSNLTDDAVKMAKSTFQGAYGDYQRGQQERESGQPYETTSVLWIYPETEDGTPLTEEQLKSFDVAVANGSRLNFTISSGQKNPFIAPWINVMVKYIANTQPLPVVTLTSPNYTALETITADTTHSNIKKVKVPVRRK